MPEGFLHAAGLVLAFAAVTIGSYGVLKSVVSLGLWPLEPSSGRTSYREVTARLGALAAARGWFAELRRSSEQALVRARMVDLAPEDIAGESLLYAIGGGVAGWVLTVLAGGAIWNVIPALVAAGIAFQVPTWNLRATAARRMSLITRRLPYSLEVVVLATEAGASFEEALAVLARKDPDEPLHEEFDQVLRDMYLGLTRREALQALVGRTGSDDIVSLVMAMDVAEQLGTPVGTTLKQQAAAIQASRLKRAEKLSHEAGPKMALPNTMIMLANVLLILAPFLPKLSLKSM